MLSVIFLKNRKNFYKGLEAESSCRPYGTDLEIRTAKDTVSFLN